MTSARTDEEREFWRRHLVLPLGLFIALAALFELAPIDLWLENAIFVWQGHAWLLQHHWLAYGVMHHDGKLLIYFIGLTALLLALGGGRIAAIRPYRLSLVYLVTCIVAIPTLIAFIKHFTQVPCPWNLVNYGATQMYQHNLSYPLGAGQGGHCFPSGHASGGFAVLALYFAAYPHISRRAWPFLLPGILLGCSFGLAQQVRGAHFLSHDLWTAFLSWFISLALYRVFPELSWSVASPPEVSHEAC